jgi:transcriptional regulator with XRE-family HTH domain
MTQQALAAELGVTHQHISRIEAGHVAPSLQLLVNLSRRLGVTTDYLLSGDDRSAFDVASAIRGEPGLTASAKKHLLGLIAELRR